MRRFIFGDLSLFFLWNGLVYFEWEKLINKKCCISFKIDSFKIEMVHNKATQEIEKKNEINKMSFTENDENAG